MRQAKSGASVSTVRKSSVLLVFLLALLFAAFYPLSITSVSKIFLLSMFLSYIITYIRHYGLSNFLSPIKVHIASILVQVSLFFLVSLIASSVMDNQMAGMFVGVLLYAVIMKKAGNVIARIKMWWLILAIMSIVFGIVELGFIASINEVELSFYVALLLLIYLVISVTGVVEAPARKAEGEYPAELIVIDSRSIKRVQLSLSRIKMMGMLGTMRVKRNAVYISPFRKLTKHDVELLEKHGIERIKIQRKIIPMEMLLYTFILSNIFAVLLLLAG